MARYIEATKCAEIISEKFGIRLFDLVDVFAEIPSADVVPKSEVDMIHYLLKDAWKRIEELDNLCGELQKAKDEVAREIFEEIDNILYKFEYPSLTAIGIINVMQAEGYHLRTRDYAKLKNKYTECEPIPATEEKYFSPEDVRKMTNQEVREKYTAIRRSMERW